MAWDMYQPTSQDEIAAKANEAAERIAQELLGGLRFSQSR